MVERPDQNRYCRIMAEAVPSVSNWASNEKGRGRISQQRQIFFRRDTPFLALPVGPGRPLATPSGKTCSFVQMILTLHGEYGFSRAPPMSSFRRSFDQTFLRSLNVALWHQTCWSPIASRIAGVLAGDPFTRQPTGDSGMNTGRRRFDLLSWKSGGTLAGWADRFGSHPMIGASPVRTPQRDFPVVRGRINSWRAACRQRSTGHTRG